MAIQLKRTTAGLTSFSVEETYGGMVEGTRGTCTKYILKWEKQNEERDGYLFVETEYVKLKTKKHRANHFGRCCIN